MNDKLSFDEFYQNTRNYYIIKGITSIVFLIFTARFALTMVENHEAGKSFNYVNLLLFIEELVTFLVIVLSRRPKDTNVTLKTTFLTAVASYYIMFVSFSDTASTVTLVPQEYCALLMVVGLLWQIASKICLGRSFGLLPANRGVVNFGPYHFMRHPIYFGYLMTHIGFVLGAFSLWNLGIYAVMWTAQCLRLLEEEKVLSRDEAYQAYQKEVPYHLIPFVF
ncbi:MAG: isoprenylcysteine carboxylmethyltransferase family protein [Methylobacteriaceae bacterium]|jgi:protein-S-isoprenylcysteine O-methyltransferase Ste14|nr:isoprenylcysteine carboxylmethyltransferase family protein [Methylobacteriaceae bacterium]